MAEIAAAENTPDNDLIRCAISAALVQRLLQLGVLRAEEVVCLDAESASCLRRRVLRSCCEGL